jgi:MFS family permease
VVAFARGFRAPFPRYWLSAFLADFGDGVRLAAFPLLAAQLTRSPAAVAAVTAVQGLPWLLLGAGAGVIVDRADSRRVMLIVDITRAAIIAALAAAILARSAGLALIYLAAFVTGAGSAVRDTAAATCVPRLIQPADLDHANGRLIAGQIIGNELAGPAAGAAGGIRAPMLAGAVPLAAVMVLLAWRHRAVKAGPRSGIGSMS